MSTVNGSPWYQDLSNILIQGSLVEDYNSNIFSARLPGDIYYLSRLGTNLLRLYNQLNVTQLDVGKSFDFKKLDTNTTSNNYVLPTETPQYVPDLMLNTSGSWANAVGSNTIKPLSSLQPIQQININDNPLISNISLPTANDIDLTSTKNGNLYKKPSSMTSNAISTVVGSVVGSGLNSVFDALGLNKTKAELAASGVLSNTGSYLVGAMANNLVEGLNLLSNLGNLSSVGLSAISAANIAYDAIDPMRKSNTDKYIGAGVGAASIAAPYLLGAAAGPVGWGLAAAYSAYNTVNHLTGGKTLSFKVDEDMYANLGSSYTGTYRDDMMSEQNANKKYSGTNLGAKRDMDLWISLSKFRDVTLGLLAKENADNNTLRGIMSTANSLNYINELNGIYSTKRGGKLFTKDFLKSKRIVSQYNLSKRKEKFQKGKPLENKDTSLENKEPSYEWTIDYAKSKNLNWVKRWLDPNRVTIPDWENPEHKVATHKLSHEIIEDGPNIGKWIVFPSVQEINGELIDFTDPKNGKTFLDTWKSMIDTKEGLIFPDKESAEWFVKHYKEYAPGFTKYKEGGSFNVINSMLLAAEPDIIELFKEEGTIETTSFVMTEKSEDEIQEYKEGGSFNVIPEGALHARLHHMDIEGITKKGIPVVSLSEGGGIEQQAEIEKNEVILRLEITKKLEELQKKYYNDNYASNEKDEFAIEAGKLLTYELLENTVDNTGLLNEV